MWERGLKSKREQTSLHFDRSLPVWERGLKLRSSSPVVSPFSVAPRVGAWIEIVYNITNSHLLIVAPRVGAWIEIGGRSISFGTNESLPVWERGLKFPTAPQSAP